MVYLKYFWSMLYVIYSHLFPLSGYLCICALVQVLAQVLAHLRTCACSCALVHLHTCASTCALTHVRMFLHICVLAQVLDHLRTCVFAHLHTCVSACTLMHLRNYLRAQELTHLRTYLRIQGCTRLFYCSRDYCSSQAIYYMAPHAEYSTVNLLSITFSQFSLLWNNLPKYIIERLKHI